LQFFILYVFAYRSEYKYKYKYRYRYRIFCSKAVLYKKIVTLEDQCILFLAIGSYCIFVHGLAFLYTAIFQKRPS